MRKEVSARVRNYWGIGNYFFAIMTGIETAYFTAFLTDAIKFPLVLANMVMLGAYIQAMGNLGVETIKEMLVHMFTGPKAKLVDMNIEALRRGAMCVE